MRYLPAPVMIIVLLAAIEVLLVLIIYQLAQIVDRLNAIIGRLDRQRLSAPRPLTPAEILAEVRRGMAEERSSAKGGQSGQQRPAIAPIPPPSNQVPKPPPPYQPNKSLITDDTTQATSPTPWLCGAVDPVFEDGMCIRRAGHAAPHVYALRDI